MSRPEVTGCAPLETAVAVTPEPRARAPPAPRKKRDLLDVPQHAFTIQEFCDAHRISRSQFYELEKKGLAPVVTNLGGKLVIMAEAATAWRRKRLAAGSRPKRPSNRTQQAGRA
jgi:hypothetical protein